MPQEYATAVSWYRKAAERGYARAQTNPGLMYGNGQGVPQDYVAAASWYREAAEQGEAFAQTNLGFMAIEGPRRRPTSRPHPVLNHDHRTQRRGGTDP